MEGPVLCRRQTHAERKSLLYSWRLGNTSSGGGPEVGHGSSTFEIQPHRGLFFQVCLTLDGSMMQSALGR